jgi:ATP-binding cassette subfamily F protein 3
VAERRSALAFDVARKGFPSRSEVPGEWGKEQAQPLYEGVVAVDGRWPIEEVYEPHVETRDREQGHIFGNVRKVPSHPRPRLLAKPPQRCIDGSVDGRDAPVAAEFGDESAAGAQCPCHTACRFARTQHPVQGGIREDRIELAVVRERLAVADDERQLGRALARRLDHVGRCVEPYDLCARSCDCRSELTGSASQVEHPLARSRGEQFDQIGGDAMDECGVRPVELGVPRLGMGAGKRHRANDSLRPCYFVSVAMTLLQVAGLRFGYAGDTLFEDVTFRLAAGDRVGLVAPNGSGKTTLLRLVAGELEPDAGSIVVRRDGRLGLYRQSHEISAQGDVLGAFLSGFREVVDLRRELQHAQEQAASGSREALDHLARVTDRYHLAHGDELEHRVSALATHLGFEPRDLARPVESLSGGERGRLRLGVVLAQQPDVLLLDEPTNHLDLDTIAWLEEWLADYAGASLVVSHDRAFLDNTCGATMELGRKTFRTYPVKYSEYVVARAADLERERALAERQQEMISKTEDFIRRNIAGQKTKQAQSRRKMLEKLDRLERPEDVWAAAERVAFRFAPAARTGDIVLDATDLGAERGGRVLFEGLDLLVRRGDRIGIVGPNGSGKTTLLKLLADRRSEQDRGFIKRGTNLQEGYFDQHLGEVDPSLTAVDNVRQVRGDYTVEAARQYLSRFRFYGDDPLRVVSGFSGGERSRLALAKLLLEPRNVLFLDEPTNHLDIAAAEILEEALAGFDGTVLLISHDRRFLENVTTRVVSIRAGQVDVYPGGFKEFEAKQEPHARAQRESRHDDGAPKNGVNDQDAKQKYEAQRQAARALEKKKRRIQDLESSIAAGEKDLDSLRGKLRAGPGDDWEQLAKMAREEQELTKKVDSMLVEWARLSEEVR